MNYDESSKFQAVDISADLDLMLLEMNDDDGNPFGEEIESREDGDEASELDIFFDEYEQQDEYELDDVDLEIFRDPTLMVKRLNNTEIITNINVGNGLSNCKMKIGIVMPGL